MSIQINVCEKCYNGKLEQLTPMFMDNLSCDICIAKGAAKYTQVCTREQLENMRNLARERINKNNSAIYEINTSKRYILSIDEYVNDEIFENLRNALREWIESGDTFLVTRGTGIRLVRVDDAPVDVERGPKQ